MVSGRRVLESEYCVLAEERGLIYKGGYTGSARAKVEWECCECGHVYGSRYDNVQSGRGCPECSRKRTADSQRISESQYRELGKKVGLEYLHGYTGHVNDSVLWRWVKCGHEWKSSYSRLAHCSLLCPKCKRERERDPRSIPETQYHVLGEKNGIVYKEGYYTGRTHAPVLWFCPVCENSWKASYDHIQAGHGCWLCSRKRAADAQRLPEEQYHILGKEGGLVYEEGYTGNTSDPVQWSCPTCGNRWETSYSNIKTGTRCPACQNYVNGAKASKIQVQIAGMLGAEVNYKIGKRYIDIALLDQHIAIEFDCWYWHGNQAEEDRARAQEIINAGWSVLAIKGSKMIPTRKQIDNALEQLGTYGELVMPDWGKGNKLIRQI